MKRGFFLFTLFSLLIHLPVGAGSAQDLGYLEKIAENKPTEALSLGENLLKTTSDEYSMARILNAEANAYTITNDFEKALACARQAEAIAGKNNFPDQLAYALLHQASAFRRLGHYQSSYDLGMRSLRIFEKTGNLKGQLLSANRISTIMMELDNFQRALEFNDRCLSLALELNDNSEYARILSNRAYFFFLQKDYANMLRYSLQAIEKYNKINDVSFIRHPMINAGVAYLELGNFREAENLLKKTIPISQKAQDKIQELIALKFLARTHKNLKDLNLARSEAMAALEIARRINNRFEVKNVCMELSEIYAQLGDYRSAHRSLNEVLKLQKELEAGGIKEKIAKSLGQFEIEKKEIQIRLLQQEKTIAELNIRQQKNLGNFLLGIAFILLVAIIFIYISFLVKKRANEAVTATNSELQAVDKIVKDINKEFELPDLIDSIFHHTLKLLPQTEKGGFLYYDEEKRVFQLVHYYGYTPAEASKLSLPAMDAARRYKLGAQTMAPGIHLIRDPENAFGATELKKVIEMPKVILALDLEVEGRTLGYLLFENMRHADAFNGPDIEKLIRIREHLISAISKVHYIGRLKRVSRTDPLTDLLNRRGMSDILSQEIERFQRYGHPFSIAIGDMDDFKKINDSYGQEYGNLVLRHVAEILRTKLRKVDSIARWDGEEFLLLLPQTTLAESVIIVEKISQEIRSNRLRYKEQEIALTITFGVSEITKGMSIEGFLRGITDALSSGKRQGKDCFVTLPIVK
jgi:diguanylate cyclase (GGDEF)-like protein